MNGYLKTDEKFVRSVMPKRREDSNKGSYGKLLVISGSASYPGAAHLCLEAALRGGVGYVTLASEESVRLSAITKFPEALYYPLPPYEAMTDNDIERILLCDAASSATLIGPGIGISPRGAELTLRLLRQGSAPLLIDADAINSLAKFSEDPINAIKNSTRSVVLTPHPLEFSRISGIAAQEVNQNRETYAKRLAAECGAVVLLKGHGTVITDGELIYVNTTGSSALAKAGSGDALAGLLGALLATGVKPLEAAAASAYIHGKAGDNLSEIYSEYGVTPSDLPKEMAKVLKRLMCQ